MGQAVLGGNRIEPFSVARPWECPPLLVGRIGTRTHCALAPLNEVVRQSFIRLGTACPTKGNSGGGPGSESQQQRRSTRGKTEKTKRLVVPHLASERSEDGGMTALPLRVTARWHSGSAYLSVQPTEVDTPTVGPLWKTQSWSRP